MERSQLSFEYILIIGVILIMSLPFIYLFYNQFSDTESKTAMVVSQRVGDQVIDISRNVYLVGRQARDIVEVDIVSDIQIILGNVTNKSQEMTFNIRTGNRRNQLIFFAPVDIFWGDCDNGIYDPQSANLPPGKHSLVIESCGDSVSIRPINESPIGFYVPDPHEKPDVGIYEISSCQQLQDIALDLSGHYALVQDIDCSETQHWNDNKGFIPIGSKDSPFTGVLDGQNHRISDLFSGHEEYSGVFGVLRNANIRNIWFDAIAVDGQRAVGLSQTIISSSISRVVIRGNITGGLFGGGLANTITNSNVFQVAVIGEVLINGATPLGGIVSLATESTLSQLVFNGTITSQGSAGGIVGILITSQLRDSFMQGSVNGVYNSGGVIGEVRESLIERTYAFSEIIQPIISNSLHSGFAQNNTIIRNSFAAEPFNQSDSIRFIHFSPPLAGQPDDRPILNMTFAPRCPIPDLPGCEQEQLINLFANNHPVYSQEVPWSNEVWEWHDLALPTLRWLTLKPIHSCSALQSISVNLDGTYVLANDIDCTGYDFMSIGSSENPFTGVLDGAGHSIIGLTTPRGLFSVGERSAVYNVTFVNPVVNPDSTPSESVGVVAGRYTGIIDGVSAVNVSVKGQQYVGGLVGMIYENDLSQSNIIRNSIVSGLVEASNEPGMKKLGGIVGIFRSMWNVEHDQKLNYMINVSFTGVVQSLDPDLTGTSVGGVVGSSDVYIINSTVNATVRSNSVNSDIWGVGGLVGSTRSEFLDYQGYIENSVAHGEVQGINNVGGLVGISQSRIINSSSTSTVEGEYAVGGLVGFNNKVGGLITNSSSSGDVIGEYRVGGIAGYSEGFISNSYKHTGSVTGVSENTPVNGVGGIAGTNIRDNAFPTSGIISNVSVGSIQVTSYLRTGKTGGIVGENRGIVNNSVSYAHVASQDEQFNWQGLYTGGFVGVNEPTGVITRSRSHGTVQGRNGLGGFAGGNWGIIRQSMSNATVTPYMVSSIIGGFVGQMGTSAILIEESFSTGDVSGSFETGGFVGLLQGGVIRDSYTQSHVSAYRDNPSDYSTYSTADKFIGGFAGKITSTTTSITLENTYAAGLFTFKYAHYAHPYTHFNCPNPRIFDSYWDQELTQWPHIRCATNLSTTQMQPALPFDGWSSDIWSFKQGHYPQLRWYAEFDYTTPTWIQHSGEDRWGTQWLGQMSHFSPTDVWTGGWAGHLWHWDGSNWTHHSSSGKWETTTITSISHTSPSDVWITGSGGNVWHWDGVGWTQHSGSGKWETTTITSISQTSPIDVWIGGWGGHLWHWDGVSWTHYSSSGKWETTTITSISHTSPTDIWITGDMGHVWHWDGLVWIPHSGAGKWGANAVRAVSHTSPTDVWIAGQSGHVWHWDGVDWTQYSGAGKWGTATITSISQTSPTDVWITGGGGNVWHWDGLSWTQHSGEGNWGIHALSSISHTSPTDVWVTGSNGNVWQYTQSPWYEQYDDMYGGATIHSFPIHESFENTEFTQVPWCHFANIGRSGSVSLFDAFMYWSYQQTQPCSPDNQWCSRRDVNRDGQVNDTDLAIIQSRLGQGNCITAPTTTYGDFPANHRIEYPWGTQGQSMALSAWIYPPDNGVWQFFKEQSTDREFDIIIVSNQDTPWGDNGIIIQDSLCFETTGIYAPDYQWDQRWHHFVIVNDGSQLKVYLDGILVDEKSSCPTSATPVLTQSYLGSIQARIQGIEYESGPGRIDQFMISNIMDESEVYTLYHQQHEQFID